MALSTISGQQRAVGFLKRVLKNETVPHAFLFSGMSGSGKLATAVEFARALNCLAPLDHDACGTCGSCRKLDEGLHPDVVRITSDGAFIKLEQVRELVKRFRFRPFEGKFRVVIIQDAQKMLEATANAMLKILEEPPEANLFILLAAESQMILPTIVSRCCQVRFQPLEDSMVAERLQREEGVSPERAAAIARLAEGSLEKARWFSGQEQTAGWKKVIERLESLETISILDFFPMIAEWAKGRETAEQDLEFIRLWVRDLIVLRLLGDTGRLTFVENVRTTEAARAVPVERLFTLYKRVELAMQGLKVNANLQMTLEGVCLAIKDFLYGKGNWNSFSKRGQALSL
ncbi:MAG: DNA polymerase III subunit delta' [Syntrophobacteraceae bacterium]